MWERFGFKQNPYDHLPISANESGERLLVGRNDEVGKLMTRIRGRNAIPTLEGDIGVGKTSIISVAAYKLEKEFFRSGGDCYLAVERPFQLDPSEGADVFSERVYRQVLPKIHNETARLTERGVNVGDTSKLYNWLTSEQYTALSANIGPLGGGVSSAPNTSDGFAKIGFQNSVNRLLQEIFPSPKRGGVICVIDNLELLEKSATAKATLEAMRDKILTAHGIIWVVCGARGIVRGVASSPRLQGYLSSPIQINPLPRNRLDGLIERRVQEYAIDRNSANAPVEQRGFEHIFRVCNDNLRTALKFSADFSEWMLENDHVDSTSQVKYELLETWLSNEANEITRDIKLTPKPWEIFDKIIDAGGSISPSDHEKFGYETPMAMRPQIKTLEDAGLVESSVDDTDQRRRTISVTSKGWLVNYSRRGYPDSGS